MRPSRRSRALSARQLCRLSASTPSPPPRSSTAAPAARHPTDRSPSSASAAMLRPSWCSCLLRGQAKFQRNRLPQKPARQCPLRRRLRCTLKRRRVPCRPRRRWRLHLLRCTLKRRRILRPLARRPLLRPLPRTLKHCELLRPTRRPLPRRLLRTLKRRKAPRRPQARRPLSPRHRPRHRKRSRTARRRRRQTPAPSSRSCLLHKLPQPTLRRANAAIRCASSGRWMPTAASPSARTSSSSSWGRARRRRSAGCGARSPPN